MLACARGYARAIKLFASLICLSTKSCERECMLFMLLIGCDMNACDDVWLVYDYGLLYEYANVIEWIAWHEIR